MRVDRAGIPRRMAYWRGRRDLSKRELGEKMRPPRTESWVEKAESGERQADFRVGVLDQVAEALDIPLERLLYDEAHAPFLECVDEVEAAAIRAALARYDVATSTFAVPIGEDPVAVDLVSRQADYGWSSFQSANFTVVARLLPELIVDAARTAAADGGDRAWSAASFVLQLAAATEVKFDDGATAWIAADRGLTAAERGGDHVVIASAARRSAEALICLGNSELALDHCIRASERLESDLLERDADGISVLGSLYLKAAVCTASMRDQAKTAALITQAREYATMLGVDGNAVGTGFGPTNTAVHEVATLSMLREGGRALDAAALIDPEALSRMRVERRVHHYADLALAQIQAGRLDQALTTLLYAEKLGKQEIHCRPRTRAIITQLAEATPVHPARLRGLAERSGVRT